MVMSVETRAFTMVRLPGEYGPILYCRGDITAAAVPPLLAEFETLELLGHRVITLHLKECAAIHATAVEAMLQLSRRLREAKGHLILVAGTGRAWLLLHSLGLARALPVFPTQEDALQALRRGSLPACAPATWEQAHAQTLEFWR